MESAYLQKCLGTCLTQGLAEVARVRPVDPIEYLALWICKYKENMTMEQLRQDEMVELERERVVALMEQQMMERLREEELLFQQQQLAFQMELEMQEKERQRNEELQRAQEQLEREAAMSLDSTARSEDFLLAEETEPGKTLAEISDRYGAPNLSRVEELEEPGSSDERPPYQPELKMQESERQRTKELQRVQEQIGKEVAIYPESTARNEEESKSLPSEETGTGKTLAETSEHVGAPNLSMVEELDEPMLSDVALNIDQDL